MSTPAPITLPSGEKLRFDTVNRAYKSLFVFYGDNFTRDVAEGVFGSLSEDMWQFVKSKYKQQGDKHRHTRLCRRLSSAKHRKAWWGAVSATDDGTIKPQSVISLLKKQDYQCGTCQCYLVAVAHKQLDHIIPVSKGGKHTITNVQWLCRSCNIGKGDKLLL